MAILKRSTGFITATVCSGLLACGGGSPSPSPTSPTPAPTSSSTPTPSPVPTPSPTSTQSPTPTPVGGEVTVDLSVQQFYADNGSLDRDKYFKMHTNFGGSDFSAEQVVDLKTRFGITHGRQFWSPLAQPAVKGSLDANAGSYPSTATAISLGNNVKSNYNNNPRSPHITNQLIVTDHPRNALHAGNEPVEGARWAADYFEHYFTDTSRPLYYEPMNEPFIHAKDYTGTHGAEQSDVREYMATWFAEIGKEFDRRSELDNVNVVGYASAWPSMELWDFGHWEQRQKMFMDVAGEYMDAFSVHLYDGINVVGANSERTGSNSQAILDLIETYSMIKWGVVKPHAITEYGAIVDRPDGEVSYDESVNAQTIRSFNGIMLELMQRDNRILVSMPFITGRASWYWQSPNQGNGHPYVPSMFRPDPTKIQFNNGSDRWEFINNNDPENYLLNINHLFFEFWKDVSGKRVVVENLDPDIQTAAYVDGDTAYIVLNNLEHGNKTVQFKLAAFASYVLDTAEMERLIIPRDAAPVHSVEMIAVSGALDGGDLDFGNLTLAEGEAIKFTIKLNNDIVFSDALRRQSYYTSNYLAAISANSEIDFVFDGVSTDTTNTELSTAMLRMSIGRDHNLSKRPTLSINGTEVSVPDDWAGYDQASRDSFFGAIDIPVDFALLRSGTNTVEVEFPDSGGRVSSMILEVNTSN